MWSFTTRHLRNPTTGRIRSGAMVTSRGRAPASSAAAERARVPRSAPPRWSWRGREASRTQGTPELRGVAQDCAADLPARGLRQLVGELHDARVLVRRGLALHVLLELAGERLARGVALAQHHHRT